MVGGIGPTVSFAWQLFSGSNVRFGSEADIGVRLSDVRFTPKSGHRAAWSASSWQCASDIFVPASRV